MQSAAINGVSRETTWRQLLVLFERADSHGPCIAWYARVASQSNISDGPSEQNDGRGLPSPASSMTGAECSNPLLQASRQRQSAAKMMVRSGLRCHKCFLKTWVCLCDRAPRELDRRGTRSAQSELYMSASSICLQGVDTPGSGVNSTPDAPRPGQKSLSSRRTARHLGWSTHKPARLWLAKVSKADSHITRSRLVQYFKRFTHYPYPSSHPRCNSVPPTRGPKSAPAPYRHDAVQKSHRRRGVRVSPLSAGGEGLCNARLRFLYAPGKLAEGIQKQLGAAPCLYSHSNWQQSPGIISSVMPWGRRFRLWKFRYKVVRHKKKRHSKPHTVAEEERHQPSRSEANTERTTSCQAAPGQLAQRRETPVSHGRPGRIRLFALLLGCLPVPGLAGTTGLPGGENPLGLRAGKQAWRRAQRQASQHGHTWYRGRLLWSAGTQHQFVVTPQPRKARRPRPVNTPRGATARLKVMTLNVGHMSVFLWGELKAHLGSGTCDYDVICLQELHWSQTCQFSVGGWSAVVSAGHDRSDGVMVLVNPKFQQSQVKYDEIIRGRLLRVQIAVADIRVEIFCCYQFVWQTTLTKEDNLRRRQSLLDKLCTQVRAIAKRSTVVVLGDFNAELVPSPGRVGQSLAHTPRHVGPEAPSPFALTRAIEELELVALNTWCSRTPHTNFTSTGKSQIDFIWVRETSADRIARRCQPSDPAIGSWRYMGHKQLDASIRLIKHYHLVKPQPSTKGVDRATMSEHARTNHPSTSVLRDRVQTALAGGAAGTPAMALQQINTILLEATATVYPPKSRTRGSHQLDFAPIWKLRDTLRKHWRRDALGLFQAWKLAHQLTALAKEARSRHIALRREKVRNILQSAQDATEAHLPHRVYQLVSQLKPWTPRPRPRLKSEKGELLTAAGEHSRLLAYCKDTFAPALPVPETGLPKLFMTAATWTQCLRQTRIGKAVPQGSAPAAAWKVCADILGPYLVTFRWC